MWKISNFKFRILISKRQNWSQDILMLNVRGLKTFSSLGIVRDIYVQFPPLKPRPDFFICWITLHLRELGKMKLCKIIALLQALFLLIRLEVNFSPKHQLICNH